MSERISELLYLFHTNDTSSGDRCGHRQHLWKRQQRKETAHWNTASVSLGNAVWPPALVVTGENTRANFRYGNETLIGCLPKSAATAIIPGAPHTWYAANPEAGARAILAFIAQH
jgi:hypothetical protein